MRRAQLMLDKPEKTMVSAGFIARRLGVSSPTLTRIRANDRSFPMPIRIHRQDRFDAAEVEAWIEKQRQRAAA